MAFHKKMFSLLKKLQISQKTETCFRHATAQVCSGQKLVQNNVMQYKIGLLNLECCRRFILGLLTWSQ